jgi:hypothetical protein
MWQNRYQELYRVGRQWRNLKQWKKSGCIYTKVDPDGPGSLALFCAACPQPGINIPQSWRSDTDTTVYTRSFVMDGNFPAVHQKRPNAVAENCLTDGHLYLVSDTKYLPYIESVKELKEVRYNTTTAFVHPCLFVSPQHAMNTTLSTTSSLCGGAKMSRESVPRHAPDMVHFVRAEWSIFNSEKGIHRHRCFVAPIAYHASIKAKEHGLLPLSRHRKQQCRGHRPLDLVLRRRLPVLCQLATESQGRQKGPPISISKDPLLWYRSIPYFRAHTAMLSATLAPIHSRGGRHRRRDFRDPLVCPERGFPQCTNFLPGCPDGALG